MPYAGFRLTCRLPHCRFAAWSSLAVSELQLSAATPLWLYHRAASLPSWIEFNCLRSAVVGKAARLSINWLDAACGLVIPLRQVALAQLYKYHHQRGNAASGKLVWKQHKAGFILEILSYSNCIGIYHFRGHEWLNDRLILILLPRVVVIIIASKVGRTGAM